MYNTYHRNLRIPASQASGIIGPQGSIGLTGPRGNTGDQGPRGFTGSPGDTGPPGVTGANGNTGDKGVAGKTGAFVFTDEFIMPDDIINSSKTITYLNGPTVENIAWATRLGSTNKRPFLARLVIDSHNNVYFNGNSSNEDLNLYNATGPNGNNIDLNPKITMTGDNNGYNYIVNYNKDGTIRWTTKIGGTNNEIPIDVVTDSDDNVYIGGYSLSNLIKLYNGTGPVGNYISLEPEIGMTGGSVDTYIVKYNKDGTILWASKIGGNSFDIPRKLIVDLDDNLYVSGSSESPLINLYDGTGPTGGSIPLGIKVTMTGSSSPSLDIRDNYIIKYNKVGTILWASKIDGSSDEIPVNLVHDKDNMIYVSGNSKSLPIKLYEGTGPTGGFIPLGQPFTMTGSNLYDNYIVKYDMNGKIVWATTVGGITGTEYPQSFIIDSQNNIYVSGYSNSSLIFLYDGKGPSGSSIPLGPKINMAGDPSASQKNENYIVKYDKQGTLLWATKVSGSDKEEPVDIAVDSHDNVYVYGISRSNIISLYDGKSPSIVSIPLEPVIQIPVDSTYSGNNSYIVKYRKDGKIDWATIIASQNNNTPRRIIIDSHDNIYINGYSSSNQIILYEGKPVISNTISLETPIAISGTSNSYIVKYRQDGTISWASKIQGNELETTDMAIDTYNDLYIIGYTEPGSITLYEGKGPTGGSISLDPEIAMEGDATGYMIKYTQQIDHYNLESATPNIKYIYNLSDNNFEINTQNNLKLDNVTQSSASGVVGSSLTLAPSGTTWIVINDNEVEYSSS